MKTALLFLMVFLSLNPLLKAQAGKVDYKKISDLIGKIRKELIVTFLSFALLACNNETIGQLSFTKSSQILGKIGRCVTSGDIDMDGDIDIIIGNLISPFERQTNNKNATDINQLWLNDGKGNFTLSMEFIGKGAYQVELADLNGDNYLDIIFATGGGLEKDPKRAPNAIWLNDGTGHFEKSDQSIGYNSLFVQIIDFNNDTYLDINIEDSVWLNDGKGNFTYSGYSITGDGIRNFTLGDLNGDNELDAFVAGFDYKNGAPCKILFNNGKGKFMENPVQIIGKSQTGKVLLGDLNGDNKLDAFLINFHDPKEPKKDEIWINDGTGKFTNGNFSELKRATYDAKLIDIDKDGDLDIYTAYFSRDESVSQYIWLNDGKGKFTDSNIRIPGQSGVTINDFDGDNKLDILVLDFNGNYLWFKSQPTHIAKR